MKSDELSRALDDGVAEVFPDLRQCEERVLAADREGDFGAVFMVSAWGERQVLTELVLAQRRGRWEELGSAGGSYDWPRLPWAPPEQGWDGALLLCSDSTQIDVEADSRETKLRVVAGFAAGAVDYVRIAYRGGERTINVKGGLRPFVAVGLGDGSLVLTPIDVDGEAVGPTWATDSH